MTASGDIVTLRDVRKTYRVYAQPADRLMELLLPGRPRHRDVHALAGVSLSIPRGERLGILGTNGSGKSTLLRILSGVLHLTSGSVEVRGRVSALLELGSGFNPELTGRENVYQQGLVTGHSRAEIDELLPRIHDFSELGEFLDQPVKTYSSGMSVRLAFSCAVFVEPEILVIDEALAVGDSYFQSKCFYKIKSMIDRGCTFIYVSHNPDSVRTLCRRAILLEHGTVVEDGNADYVSDAYTSRIFERQARQSWYPERTSSAVEAPVQTASSTELFSASDEFARRVTGLRQGSGEVRITDVQIVDAEGRRVETSEIDDDITIRVSMEAHAAIEGRLSVGVAVCDAHGAQILQFMSHDEGAAIDRFDPARRYVLDFTFRNCLAPGEYRVNAGVAEQESNPAFPSQTFHTRIFDTCFGGAIFQVARWRKKNVFGRVSVPVRVKLHT